MITDATPVWKFFEIPDNAIEICHELVKKYPDNLKEKQHWERAAVFLEKVKIQTADQLIDRDFDWILKLRVLFEKDETVNRIRSEMNK